MSDGRQPEMEARDPVVGTVIDGRFQIEALLGRGGMGAVYRATHLQLGKLVALKLMHGSLLGDTRLRERFAREVKACSALNHPNIVRILSSGVSTDGHPYVAMDYVQGGTLSRRLSDEGRMKPVAALPILMQVAGALACAHAHGVAHRDVKPSNVMLATSSEGTTQALVVDFGLSKFITDERGQMDVQTQTATTMQGSPLYMSPEQCQSQKTDYRTDVYSFGCLMYEMLSGKPPFEGDSAFALMYEHVNAPPPLFDTSLGIPNSLQNVVFRCLSKRPEERYATAGDIVSALEDSDRETGPRHPGAQRGLRKSDRKRSPSTPIAVALAILGVIGLVLTFYAWNQLGMLLPNDNAAKRLGLVFDNLGLYDAEANLYAKYADHQLQESGFVPKTTRAIDPKFRKVASYSRFTVRAVATAARANPAGQAEYATQSFYKLRDLLEGDMNGTSPLQPAVIVRVLLDSAALMELISQADTTPPSRVGEEGMKLGILLSQRHKHDVAERVLLLSFKIMEDVNRDNLVNLSGCTYWIADNYLNSGGRAGNAADLEKAIVYFDRCAAYRRKKQLPPEYEATLHAHKAQAFRMLKRFDEASKEEALALADLKRVSDLRYSEAHAYYWAELARVLRYEHDKKRIAEATEKSEQFARAVVAEDAAARELP